MFKGFITVTARHGDDLIGEFDMWYDHGWWYQVRGERENHHGPFKTTEQAYVDAYNSCF